MCVYVCVCVGGGGGVPQHNHFPALDILLGMMKLTISITIFLRVCFCLRVRLTKISHSGVWSSLKATAKWWFSSTDSSLYIRASSEPARLRTSGSNLNRFRLTCVDKVLVCEARVVDVMDRRREHRRHHLGGGSEHQSIMEISLITSSGVKTDSRAGELSKVFMERVTSAAWLLLWYGTLKKTL